MEGGTPKVPREDMTPLTGTVTLLKGEMTSFEADAATATVVRQPGVMATIAGEAETTEKLKGEGADMTVNISTEADMTTKI